MRHRSRAERRWHVVQSRLLLAQQHDVDLHTGSGPAAITNVPLTRRQGFGSLRANALSPDEMKRVGSSQTRIVLPKLRRDKLAELKENQHAF